jgi:DNA-binding transcriptional LysR family regulator
MSIISSDAVPGVEIRHLVALRAIAETRSFSRAAEQLGYAQSAVSQQIASLERALGTTLVERPGGPRPVSLTEAGQVLLRHSERILGRLSAAQADLRALAAGEAGTIRVGMFQSVGARVLPAVLRSFRQGWPQVRVELGSFADDRMLLERIEAGSLDVSFALQFGDSALEPRFAFRPLLSDPYVLIAPPDSPFAGRDEVSLAELDGIDVIASDDGSTCGRLMDAAWRRAGATPNVVYATEDNLIIQRLVGTGLGHAVQPELAVERSADPEGVIAIPVTDIEPREIGVVWMRDRQLSPAAQAFIDVAVEVTADAFAPAL